MNADSILLVSVIIAGLIIPSFIIMFLCFNYKSKKTSKKIFSLVACMPLSIAICFLCLSASLINVANTNLNDMKNQQELFKDLVNDLKYYNEYITDYSEITENCDENGGEHYHYIKINYDNVICEYTDKTQLTNKAENMSKLVYNFHALEQPNFVNYFYEFYYNKFKYFINLIINTSYIESYMYSETFDLNSVNICGTNLNPIMIVENRSYSHNDKEFNKNSILNDAYNFQQITDSINTLENNMDFYSRINETTYRDNAESKTQNIVYICFLSSAIIINIINIILSLTLKNKHQTINYNNPINNELNKKIANNNSISEIDNNENIIEDKKNIVEEKKKWEDLSDEDKQPYIEWAIKNLYEKQLDNNEEVKKLSREKLALKKMCIKNNEYYIQDLSAKEKQLVIKEAQLSYENDEHETEDDYDYDKTTHVLEQYSDKELKKILPKAVRQFYKMSIDIDELRENLTIDTIEEYRKRLYDGNYSYELLNEEEKRCVNAIIVGNEEGSEAKSIKKKECDEKYQTSVRKKLDRDIVKFKIIEVSVVLVIIVLVSLGVFLLNSMALSLVSFVIGALVCIGIFANIMSLEAERKQYCPKCGAKGIVKNTSHSENLRINRKEASQSDINSNRGHLTRDNEGHLFIEELVTDVHETNIMICPRCENQWINYNNRTIKH